MPKSRSLRSGFFQEIMNTVTPLIDQMFHERIFQPQIKNIYFMIQAGVIRSGSGRTLSVLGSY